MESKEQKETSSSDQKGSSSATGAVNNDLSPNLDLRMRHHDSGSLQRPAGTGGERSESYRPEKEVSFDAKSIGSDRVDGTANSMGPNSNNNNGVNGTVKKKLGSRMRLESTDTEGSEVSTTMEREPPDGGYG